MNKFIFISSLILLAIVPFSLFSQDQIIKRNLEVINCKIKEIGSNEIKYTVSDYPSDVFFAIEKDKVVKIIFEDGRELTISDAMSDPKNYEGQKKNALKVDFFSPLTGNTTIAYERSLKPGRSIEGSLGLIGLGTDPNNNNPSGAFVKFGLRFIKNPDFYLQGMRYAHILKGSYFMPEISISSYMRDFEEYDPRYPPGYQYYTERKSVFSGAINMVFGKQWVYDNALLIDFYAGIGYGFDNTDGGYHYGHVVSSNNFPVSFSAGLKFGFLFH
ncbi:MAG: hypothetical protein IH598_06085 [Bacteroidales bacterium]|nr:hypothetical protein [Bacteroidales bacterium]